MIEVKKGILYGIPFFNASERCLCGFYFGWAWYTLATIFQPSSNFRSDR